MKREYSDIGGIQQQAADIIRQAYDKGYKAGYVDGKDEAYKNPVPTQDAYNNGLHDAWECVKKIDDMSLEDLRPILSTDDIGWIAKTFSVSEAIAKIKEYEEKQKQADDEIKVGDEVIQIDADGNYVVTALNEDDESYALLLSKTGFYAYRKVIKLKKTGRHFPQIAEVLDQMKEGEQDGQ